MKKYICVITLCIGSWLHGQNNLFLTKPFWEKNPSIEELKNNMSKINSISELNERGFDPVVYAIQGGASNSTIEYLIEKEGNSVNKLTHHKRTYIFWAASKNNVELMKYLIDHGANLDIRDSHNYSVLTFAATTGQTNKKIYDLCIASGMAVKNDLNENGANALLLLIGSLTDLEMVEYFENKGLSINDLDNLGSGVFNYAARSGNKKIQDKLIARGIAVDLVDSKGNNAILVASKGSRRKTNSLAYFKYLEEKGVKVNITNKRGVNAIHNLAFSSKEVASIEYFESKGVPTDISDARGNNALMNASSRNNIEVIKYLRSKTKDINHQNNEGNSALTNAVSKNSHHIVQYLIKEGADINVVDTDGYNLSSYLIKSYNNDRANNFRNKFEALKTSGVDFLKKQKDNSTYLHLAVEKRDINLLKMLENIPVDVNAKNEDGLTALHMVAMTSSDEKILKYLLFIGADKNIKTEFEETAYELAKENELLKLNNINIEFLKNEN